MDRRQFLKASGAAAVLGSLGAAVAPARALGPAQRLRILRLRHGGRWDARMDATPALAEEVRLRTSIDVALDPLAVRATQETFKHHPLAILAGDSAFSFTDEERAVLERWIGLGGFLLLDNTGDGAPSEAFDASARAELDKLFPRTPLRKISPEHVIYRSFYRLDYPAGRAIHKPYVEGLTLGYRQAVVLSHNDLLGAFARDVGGSYRHTPTPGGDNQREMAFRFAVNLVMYALCLHYKDDQVHLDYLLHRRKWKIHRPGR